MTENYFLTRKSCRKFKPETIDSELLDEILFQAAKAPTCGNMQLYSVVVTKDKNLLNKLVPFHYNQPAASTAPIILTICADFNRFSKWCEINNADQAYNNFHSFIMAMTDAVIFSQQIVTIAENKGLGTCYLGTVTYNASEISKLLDLPDLVIPVASIAIGVPECEGESTDRIPIEGFVHLEKYKKQNELDLKNVFKIHEGNPQSEKFIKENNKENLAQVFSEIRYPRETNEKISRSFLKLLKDKGFSGGLF